MITGNNCLITGGGGFIGLHLAQRLKRLGCKVTILDVKEIDSDEHEGIDFIQADVLEHGLMQQLVPHYDYVFHLAALLGVRRTVDDPVPMIENNLLGTQAVLKAAMQSGSKVIFASSSEVYGKARPPFREDGDLVFGTPAKLRWSYAIAKTLEESLCLGYGHQGLPVTIVRYFNVYGPRQKEGLYGGVVPRFIKAALAGQEIPVYGSGEQTRSFTFVEDAVELTIRAALEAETDRQIFNIGTGNEISILRLAAMIKNLAGSSSSIAHIPFEKAYPNGFEEIPRRRPDPTKIESILEYKAETSLEDGLAQTIAWYKQKYSGSVGE